LVAQGWLLKVLRWFPGIKTVVYIHGEEITTSLSNKSETGRIKSSLISSDHIVAVSRFTLEVTAKLIGPDYRSKISLIQNGVDIDKFQPGPRSEALRANYDLDDNTFIFVSVSRLVEKKGHDKTIVALASVLKFFPDTKLLIVGDGPFLGKLMQITECLGLESAVRFTGSVPEDELADHYRLGQVFVMPNRALPDGDTEGFGLVFLEANGCGLPVIAGQDGGSLEAVTNGINGLVVDGNSEDEITSAMLRLRGDAALRTSLRANGLLRAREFDWGSRADLFLRTCSGRKTA
jgi:phosphatidylinositol alpha-1,6-mannosyltransferase